MPAIVCLDVIDRPRLGVPRSLMALRALARQPDRPLGCEALIPCATANFRATGFPGPTRRIAVVSAWADDDALERATSESLADHTREAGEHWRVRCQLVRVSDDPDPWRGWLPEPAEVPALDDEEPLLVLVSGELRPGAVPAFVRDTARAYAQASTHAGYLGGLGLISSPLGMTSCSAWRSSVDSRAYAFRPGGHADALRNDREHQHQKTERHLRLRPLTSHGTLAGRDPFAGLLAGPVG